MIRRLVVFAWAFLAASSSAQTGYTISGTVVAGTTNKPLKHVLVTITPVGTARDEASGITGEDGRFMFHNLPAGKFALTAQKQDTYIEAFHENDGYSTAIVTGPDLKSENIVFPLTMLATITGTVNDDQGEPVRDAEALLFRRGVFGGKLESELRASAQTDSSGIFHFGQLKPGTYLIAVQARPWYAQTEVAFRDDGARPAPSPEFDVAYPLTYYGGSTEANSAAPITLAQGESTKIEITLREVPAVHIQIPQAATEGGRGINIFIAGPSGYKIPVNGMFMATDKHEEVTGIAPGRYLVQKQSGGVMTVDFSGNSVLPLGEIPESSISGHLTFEGEEHPTENNLMFVAGTGEVVSTRVAEDGSFKTAGAQPGRYYVRLGDTPEYYVKSVAVGGRAVPDQVVEVSDGAAAQVTIVAAKGRSNIDGIAVKEGAPFAGAMVLLLPHDLNSTSLIREDQSDGDGTFTLPSASPGRYTVVAIDDGRDLAYAEPGVINPYLKGGQVIDVPLPPGSQVKVNVQHRQP